MDILYDFSSSYDDFGIDVSINGATDTVKFMFDEGLEEKDNKITPMRVLKTVEVDRGDSVLMQGKTYKVARVTPHGDQNEENIVSMVEQ